MPTLGIYIKSALIFKGREIIMKNGQTFNLKIGNKIHIQIHMVHGLYIMLNTQAIAFNVSLPSEFHHPLWRHLSSEENEPYNQL